MTYVKLEIFTDPEYDISANGRCFVQTYRVVLCKFVFRKTNISYRFRFVIHVLYTVSQTAYMHRAKLRGTNAKTPRKYYKRNDLKIKNNLKKVKKNMLSITDIAKTFLAI